MTRSPLPTRRARLTAAAAVATVLAMVAGCGSSSYIDDPTAASTTTTTPSPRLTGGALTGLKGTSPRSTLSDAFLAELRAADPTLGDDVAFAAEAHDVVVVSAIAAELASSDAPARIAGRIVGVTREGRKCTDLDSCTKLIEDDRDPDYDGASGAIEMLPNGEPSEATYAELRFDRNDHLDQLTLKNAQAPDALSTDPPPPPSPGAPPAADGVLRFGALLPLTGPQEALGKAELAGITAAVTELNDGGGVLGRPVEVVKADSADGSGDPQRAIAAAQKLVDAGVDVVVGPATSAVAKDVIGIICGAGIIAFSPSDTARADSQLATVNLFFRLAPSDLLQAEVLADMAAGDGLLKMTVIHQPGAYGDGLAEDFIKYFALLGGKTPANVTAIASDAPSLGPAVEEALAPQPEGILLLGDDQFVARTVKQLAQRGATPSDLPMYTGNISVGIAQQYAAP